MSFDPNHQRFEARYLPKDFENIDKQQEEIVYRSTQIPIHSNYFYSVFQPDYNSFIWQSVSQIVEMRPISNELPIGQAALSQTKV